LQAISIKAGTAKAHRFQNLYGSLNESLLDKAWRNLNKRGAPGVDKVTIAQYGENLGENIKRLVERLKREEYRIRLIRRKYIPKGNGKERPLGIPVVEDRLLQGAARLLLEAIYEQDFHAVSYGYRRKVGAQQAVKDLTFEFQFGRYGYVVEADIKGFFDNIDHDWLLRMLEERVDDKPFLGLIDSWLKAGILERDGAVIHPQTGTPQAGWSRRFWRTFVSTTRWTTGSNGWSNRAVRGRRTSCVLRMARRYRRETDGVKVPWPKLFVRGPSRRSGLRSDPSAQVTWNDGYKAAGCNTSELESAS